MGGGGVGCLPYQTRQRSKLGLASRSAKRLDGRHCWGTIAAEEVAGWEDQGKKKKKKQGVGGLIAVHRARRFSLDVLSHPVLETHSCFPPADEAREGDTWPPLSLPPTTFLVVFHSRRSEKEKKKKNPRKTSHWRSGLSGPCF